MGIQHRCCYYYGVLLWVILCLLMRRCSSIHQQQPQQKDSTICSLSGCNCTVAAPAWTNVNCSFSNTQSVELDSKSIPGNVVEFFFSGGKDLIVHPQTFTSLLGLSLVRIEGTQSVILGRHSFYNISSPNLLIQVQNSRKLFIEAFAFKNMQSSIETEVSRVDSVFIEKSAFSRLHNGRFKDIQNLQLSEGTFEFENQGSVGRHGPVTMLSFTHVTIPTIPRSTFFSSLAEINIQNSEIREIQQEAFTASQISAIFIMNTSINRIKSGAFSTRTQIFNFEVSKSSVTSMESNAIMAAITNLTVQHSMITDIESGAVNSTVANTVISDNEIANFRTSAFVLNDWNKVNVDNNIINHLSKDFLQLSSNTEVYECTFTGNEVHHAYDATFRFLLALKRVLNFDNNSFYEKCRCDIDKWLERLFNSSDVLFAMDSSYCLITKPLSTCFELQEGLINMQNFTKLVCGEGEQIICEPYKGDTKVMDTTSKVLMDADSDETNSNGFILGLTLGALLIIAVAGTIVILLIRGGLWLKRKGYFRNIRYNQNENSNDDENTIVTVDRNDKFDMPEELTPELLQTLRDRLDDPSTHNEAREMIERLYDMFIVDESYTNNNRQDEEAHLYEELGNLQSHNNLAATPAEKLEQLQASDNQENTKPTLVGDYSEPNDAAVHLYSELKQNRSEPKTGSVKSNGSNMSHRPLPDKPESNLAQAGPSKR